jgi:hypothetical protein
MKSHFTFEAVAADTHGDYQTNTKKFSADDESLTWMKVLNEFADFLSGVYGYDVKDKIILNMPDGLTTLRNQQLEEAIAEEF